MQSTQWLTARPVAHRGFHDAGAGRIENTPGAIAAAVARGFAIEIDVHLSADGKVYAFHDETLDRLTEGHGPTAGMTLAELKAVPFKATADRIPSLDEVLEIVGGRSTLVVEIKSHFGARQRDLVAAVAATLQRYQGPVAAMSFDPRMVEDLGEVAPGILRGIVADDATDPHDYGDLDAAARAGLAALDHLQRSRPQFIAYWVKLLPSPVVTAARAASPMPLLTWTVRTPDDRAAATAHADQMIFEGFDPEV